MTSLDSLDVTVGFDRTYLLVVSARVSALALHSAYYGWEGEAAHCCRYHGDWCTSVGKNVLVNDCFNSLRLTTNVRLGRRWATPLHASRASADSCERSRGVLDTL